jgi:hypothetical protein
LVIGWSLERQEGFHELPHVLRPSGAMVPPEMCRVKVVGC